MKGKNNKHHSHHYHLIKILFWFFIGLSLGLLFVIGFTFIFFQNKYLNKIYPGITVNGIDMSEMSKDEVKDFFDRKNKKMEDIHFTFVKDDNMATISAKKLEMGYNSNLLANQAYYLGRSKDLLSNISIIFQAGINGIDLSPSYMYADNELLKLLDPIIQQYKINPVNALFTFENGKVVAFRLSSEGSFVDIVALKKAIWIKIPNITFYEKMRTIIIPIPIKIIKPEIDIDKANNLGIKELIGSGTSLFHGSIKERVYNINLAVSKINGILINNNEIFSFNKYLGDISAFTGFKKAYTIQNGKTILGDGGGVCQVSTTLFRATLNAGLPIIERHAHTYRVGYYEQESDPGIDATIYSPSIDFKFKNDTGHSILIQSFVDNNFERLSILFYGSNDNRQTTISKSIITTQIAPGETIYQDDSSLAKGQIKQTEYATWGANVYFIREVKKNGKIIISEKYSSYYQPWASVFIKGTKEI
ncbi:MAG: VanW family protein [Candidatus Levybacteria bacterium]|nr:VanW family protein [Candidatus Levybacteria bacterium]